VVKFRQSHPPTQEATAVRPWGSTWFGLEPQAIDERVASTSFALDMAGTISYTYSIQGTGAMWVRSQVLWGLG
jgi:hypothetical protein